MVERARSDAGTPLSARRGGRTRGAPRPPITGQLHRLPLDRTAGAPPLYAQIRDSVRAAVLTGALAPGMRLPPERELATSLGVNRTTTMRAYQELVDDGVVEAHSGRGTIVRQYDEQMDGDIARRSLSASWLLGLGAVGQGLGPDPGLLREMVALSQRGDVVSFAGGTPTEEMLPLADVQAAITDSFAAAGAASLGYGPVEGFASLRVVIGARMARRGAPFAEDEILILSGATQGLALAARALIEPGDEVVVESPTYVGIVQTFMAAGARLIGVPVDGGGLRLDALTAVLARRRVKLIVVQPTLHNPTGATMPLMRRERLVALARRHGVPILEDAPYAELWDDGPEPPPLAALDREGLVLHLGSFSKTLAPGLRVGWLAGPAAAVVRLTLTKQVADLNTGTLSQMAVERLLSSGAYDAHLSRVRHHYAERRAVLRAGLGSVEALDVPPDSGGGFYLWSRLRQGKGRLLAVEASKVGVSLLPGEPFYPPNVGAGDNGGDRIRLSVAGVTASRIALGLERLLPLLEKRPYAGQTDERTMGQMPLI